MDYTVAHFSKLSLLMSIIWSGIFMVPIGWIITQRVENYIPAILICYVFLFILMFFIIIYVPKLNKQTLEKKIEGEIAVTGRRLLIQIESGKSLVNSIIDVAKHKKESSRSLQRIAYELYMGKPLEKAIVEAIEMSPSKTFRKIFVQIKNSLKTGADLKHTLKAALEDITREKMIEFESFGKKLNPLGLFYMIFGTIGPSLGIVLFVVFLTMFSIPVRGGILILFIIGILALQLMFVGIFSNMRPELEI